VVRYILSSVEAQLELNRRCPQCGRTNGNIHSREGRRAIRDLKARQVVQRRMKCPWCGVTWTIRCGGVRSGRRRSDRLRGIGVILYMLGLSYRAVETFLQCLECSGGKSSIERDVAEAGERARGLHSQAPRMKVRVLGVDGTGAAMAGRDAGMLFFVDIDRGRLVCVEAVNEEDTMEVRAHVAQVMGEVSAEELRTDEHSVYEGIVEEGAHRLCLTHWRKSKGKRCVDLYAEGVKAGRVMAAGSMGLLLKILRREPRAASVPRELRWLVGRYARKRKGLGWKINKLLEHVERTWEKVSDDPHDATNNVTERIIGLSFKIRAKTMRGFKSDRKVLEHPHLWEFLRGEGGIADLRKIS